ncbi:CBS domain-containing protein [Actinoallomurus spadix]|uniref:CBS domain-containing protein n=1 Tax=Actinoallomurus spadix TaxID=79912 RepID=A0ABN0WQV6_9ACTN|nr:CBS domain-containing protein [Actinoallomurus spadix]MCO5991675.1 CBS domain-containing protein [Actinoallomurus spadix]
MSVCVAQVMSDHVIAVREHATFAEIAAVMNRCRVASLPVIDTGNRVIGVVTEDDLLLRETPPGGALTGPRRRRAEHRKRTALTADRLMTAPAVTVTPDTPVRRAARLMHRHRIHHLPVVDPATGRLRGIVSRSDLLTVYERHDEDIHREITRDVIEETFALEPGDFTVAVAQGTVTVHGTVRHRSTAEALLRAIEAVDGVIEVRDHVRYRWDDTGVIPRAYL